jgi:tetrapyrrole methylase family protein / MazG family protein
VTDRRPHALTIAGLGPGDASLLTLEAHRVLAAAPEVWLRTSRHPTVAGLPSGPRYESFDDVYESGASFDEVYETIVSRVLELAARPEGVVYAVPGHPLFGEATVAELLRRAEDAGMSTRVVAGVSFLDAAAAALRVDPLDGGLLVLDALALAGGRSLAPQRPALIAQVYDQRTASHAKLALLERYPGDHPVRVVLAAGTQDERTVDAPLAELDRVVTFDHLATLYVPPLVPFEDLRSFAGLRAVVAQLRNPEGGCPWDLEQTHETLKRFLMEEAYEALDALDEGDAARLAEELGDLLMQVVLHAQVAEDEGTFTIEDVLASITAKLVRRHPHVFGDVTVAGAAEVIRNWEELKKDERGDRPLLDAVPKAMPALAQASAVLGRSEKAGFGAPPLDPARAVESLDRLARHEHDGEAELGELLLAVVALARAADIDAEEALRGAIRRVRDAVAEREAAAQT